MITIESQSNEIYKLAKKLLTHSGRKKSGMFIAEGERIVKDAVSGGACPEYILLRKGQSFEWLDSVQNVRVYQMSEKLFDTLKCTVNSQGIIAVFKSVTHSAAEIDYGSDGCYLYLDGITDPGNMGTILRTACAFGVKGVVLSDGCADVYNPKVVRSTMAGIFAVPIYDGGKTALGRFAESGFCIVGAFPNGGADIGNFEFPNKSVVVVGNEANGICPETEAMCSKKVTIPMSEYAESLNVSIACGIMLYRAFVTCSKKGGHSLE